MQDLDRRPADRFLLRHAGDLFGSGVPKDDLAVAVDRDDAVGDVREDRDAAFLLQGDARVELRVRERGRRVSCQREQRLDLLGPPLSRFGGVDGEHAGQRAFGTGEGHAQKRCVPGQEDRIGTCQPFVGSDVFDRERRARLEDVA